MKKNKSIILIFILLSLVFINIFYEYRHMDFSSDPNDNKQIKVSNKFKFEDDDNKFQIISDCFKTFYEVSNLEDGNIVKSISSTKRSNVDNFSIQKIYKLEKDKKSLSYIEVYEIINNKLITSYYKIKLNYENYTFFIETSDISDFNKAIRNKADRNMDFSINVNKNVDNIYEYNSFRYSDNAAKIAYRYINDFVIKYNYSKKEAKKITDNIDQISKVNKIDQNEIVSFKKEINDDYITYFILTDTNTYEINVSSPLNYKIIIK